MTKKTSIDPQMAMSTDRESPPYPPEAPDPALLGGGPPGVGLPDAEALDADGGFWVFGYGSLLWRPGVEFDQQRDAVLDGYERAFCLWSVRYRGTAAAPGLVLGVRPKSGASTRGIAFHVPAAHVAEARAHLRERELVTGAYKERKAALRLVDADGADTGERLRALSYFVDVEHPQYTGVLSLERQAEIIAAASGARGPNCDYLFNTAAHFREVGLAGADIEEMYTLDRLVRAAMAKADET